MKFIADLHVHSKFSRATAKNLDLENMYISAQLKGITVIGTGDFTHPGWFSEIKEKLIPAEQGLFQLKPDIAKICDECVFSSCRQPVRFLLVSEISNIYKKNDKTRKNHNLVFLPDLDTASRFNERLDAIGNISSDGRPILGLDARDLLEILLETSDQGMLIPAHIWTPWFSMLGSKSGYDSLQECFADLSSHIHAVETGLSSDPAMNWRISDLDGLTLVSNSDAHSPSNLGREANLFDTTLSYEKIMSAIKTGDPKRFSGTIEFYPEEGKYHLDGHRKCNVRLEPERTQSSGCLCPECGKPLTLGVLHRVEELADRPAGEKPEKKHPYFNLIPLSEILSEILQVGAKSKRVQEKYRHLLDKLGPEINILRTLETDEIEAAGIPLLGEAIRRMRRKEIFIEPGYDGIFGKITVFKPEERTLISGQRSLFQPAVKKRLPASDRQPESNVPANENPAGSTQNRSPERSIRKPIRRSTIIRSIGGELEKKATCPIETMPGVKNSIIGDLNDRQRLAVEYGSGPMLIVAGPGTGKTRTITHRIAYLIREKGIPPEKILAVTFTNKAAGEMKARLKGMLTHRSGLPFISTFHSFCLAMLTEQQTKNGGIAPQIVPEEDRILMVEAAIKQVERNGFSVSGSGADLLNRIGLAKQNILGPDECLASIVSKEQPEDQAQNHPENHLEKKMNEFVLVYRTYQEILAMQGLYDYEDLIADVVRRLETDGAFRIRLRDRFAYIFVDEYQDINTGQYRVIGALSPPEKDLCVIGDPDQSIYGFRGSDVRYFDRFLEDYPDARVVRLTRNYRSTQSILEASLQIVEAGRTIQSNRLSMSASRGVDGRIYSGIDGTQREPLAGLLNI